MSDQDRERVLQLLQELETWTSEYSGNVTEYHEKINELTRDFQSSPKSSQADNRILLLLQQIMDSNDKLQTRLDAAERQLEKQTRQIESYLTEARTDSLTGLFNRRAFDQKLEELFGTYRNGGRSFVVVPINPGVQIRLKLIEFSVDFLAKGDLVELLLDRSMKALADTVGLRTVRFRA